MPDLTRRREKGVHQESWHIYYGDVQVGTISERAGVPNSAPQWGWNCGLYPGMEPGEQQRGTGATFEEARAGFEEAWRGILLTLPAEAFEENRRATSLTRWKYAIWEAGCRMPTQNQNGRSRCFCGEEIGVDCEAHIYAVHMEKRD